MQNGFLLSVPEFCTTKLGYGNLPYLKHILKLPLDFNGGGSVEVK